MSKWILDFENDPPPSQVCGQANPEFYKYNFVEAIALDVGGSIPLFGWAVRAPCLWSEAADAGLAKRKPSNKYERILDISSKVPFLPIPAFTILGIMSRMETADPCGEQ